MISTEQWDKMSLTERKDYIEKKEKIKDLLLNVDDILIDKFFDIESDNLLDEKIEVLTALASGKAPADVANYYNILELYPKNQNWD